MMAKIRRVRSFFGVEGGGGTLSLKRTPCQQSLKYISLYNTGGAPFSTEKRKHLFVYVRYVIS